MLGILSHGLGCVPMGRDVAPGIRMSLGYCPLCSHHPKPLILLIPRASFPQATPMPERSLDLGSCRAPHFFPVAFQPQKPLWAPCPASRAAGSQSQRKPSSPAALDGDKLLSVLWADSDMKGLWDCWGGKGENSEEQPGKG